MNSRRSRGENALSIERLQEIIKMFEEAAGGDGEDDGLDEDAFVRAFGQLLGADMTDMQLRMLFMKIDVNADGSVSWDEFSNFIVQESSGSASLGDQEGFGGFTAQDYQDPPGVVAKYHREPIIKVVHAAKLDMYITASRDGSVRFWRASRLAHLKTINFQSKKDLFGPAAEAASAAAAAAAAAASSFGTEGEGGGGVWGRLAYEGLKSHGRAGAQGVPSKAWITDIVFLEHYNRLVVSAMDRSLTIYDAATFGPTVYVDNIPYAPLCMAFHGDDRGCLLCIGDDNGGLLILEGRPDRDGTDWREYFAIKDRHVREAHGGAGQQDKIIVDVSDYTPQPVHKNWVTHVEIIPEINAIVTCSLDKRVSVFDLDKREVVRVLEGHEKGIYSFSYCSGVRILATCGLERFIYLWNPYIKKSIAKLEGHLSSVVALASIPGKTASILVSLGADKVMKVWDVRTYRCVQTINDKVYRMPDDRFCSLMYDGKHGRLVATFLGLAIWNHDGFTPADEEPEFQERTVKSHSGQICRALYNANFDQVVSGDHQSTVCTWNVETGELLVRFEKAHGHSRITAMAFDKLERRLITGAHDGSIKVWNFNNGAAIKNLLPYDASLAEDQSHHHHHHHHHQQQQQQQHKRSPSSQGGGGDGDGEDHIRPHAERTDSPPPATSEEAKRRTMKRREEAKARQAAQYQQYHPKQRTAPVAMKASSVNPTIGSEVTAVCFFHITEEERNRIKSGIEEQQAQHAQQQAQLHTPPPSTQQSFAHLTSHHGGLKGGGASFLGGGAGNILSSRGGTSTSLSGNRSPAGLSTQQSQSPSQSQSLLKQGQPQQGPAGGTPGAGAEKKGGGDDETKDLIKVYLAAGWDRKVSVWTDSAGDSPDEPCARQFLGSHDADITDIVCIPPAMCCTCSVDGFMRVWIAGSGVLRSAAQVPPDLTGRVRQSLEKIVILPKRQNALVTIGGVDPHLRIWTIDENSNRIRHVKAVHTGHYGDVISLAVNKANDLLFTGDSFGLVKVWTVDANLQKNVGFPGAGISMSVAAPRSGVSGLLAGAVSSLASQATASGAGSGLGPSSGQGLGPGSAPAGPGGSAALLGSSIGDLSSLTTALLEARSPITLTAKTSWRAHMSACTSLDVVEKHKMVITASADSTIAMWTSSGKYVGTFGKIPPGADTPWDVNNSQTWSPFETLPQPVKPVFTTTFVEALGSGNSILPPQPSQQLPQQQQQQQGVAASSVKSIAGRILHKDTGGKGGPEGSAAGTAAPQQPQPASSSASAALSEAARALQTDKEEQASVIQLYNSSPYSARGRAMGLPLIHPALKIAEADERVYSHLEVDSRWSQLGVPKYKAPEAVNTSSDILAVDSMGAANPLLRANARAAARDNAAKRAGNIGQGPVTPVRVAPKDSSVALGVLAARKGSISVRHASGHN